MMQVAAVVVVSLAVAVAATLATLGRSKVLVAKVQVLVSWR